MTAWFWRLAGLGRLPAAGFTHSRARLLGQLGDTKNARLYRRKVRAIYPDFDVDKWLSVVPFKEQWQKEQYREALRGPVSEIWFRTAGKSCHARVTRVLP
ncbi:hypothetical protein E0H65_23905 [Rhizobium leguminosarum bv. viciae]|nr:hypothetical protein E0H65_23905 [Rhizobium leguminosarum bv. viciae]